MSEGSIHLGGNSSQQSTKHKVQLCRSFASIGLCPYGDICIFAHGLEELLAHQPIHKTKKCRNYHSNGYCRFGERCNFLHEKVVKHHKKKKLYRFHKILDSYAQLVLHAATSKMDSFNFAFQSEESSLE